MNWRFAYTIGFHPWEDAATDAPFVAKALELFAREETGRQPPYGPALDLGTGSGIWGIELAKRGWQVTGVDFVESALRRAHGRVRKAGVDMRLIHGDVTALQAAGVEGRTSSLLPGVRLVVYCRAVVRLRRLRSE